jgi:hypothetical protein
MDPKKTVTFTEWYDDVATCGTYQYSATLSDGTALPDFIVFTPSLKKFEI